MKAADIIKYYEESYLDYWWIWSLGKTHSIHYGYYDAEHRTHAKAVVNMNGIMADIAGIDSSDHVLDAGCGVGGSSIWLAKNRGAQATGINITEMHLKIAAKLVKKYQLEDRVQFQLKSYMETGFEEKSFDVVWGLESICYAPNKKDFLQEAHRVLKNGGRLVVADGFLSNSPLNPEEQTEVDKWVNGWAVDHLARVDDFKTYLEELGFKNITYNNITENVMPSSVRMYRFGRLTFWIALFLEWLGFRSKVQTQNVLAALYQHTSLKKGLWQYGIFYAEKVPSAQVVKN